jgi:hypothetical protein
VNESAGAPGASGSEQPPARLTPYELVFTEGEFESRIFPRITAEADEQGIQTRQPERFEFLSTAADVIRELVPDGSPPDALEQYRALLYHAYHFWQAGRPLYSLEESAARHVVGGAADLRDGTFRLPAPSLYLQLPANLFWSSIAPDTAPEPVDGFFLTLYEGVDGLGTDFQHLEVLMVLGIRRSRAGFSIIPLGLEIGPALEEMDRADEREGGDFSNVLPGGEIAGLYSILTSAEVLKLIARVFRYVEAAPECLERVAGPVVRTEDEEPPSSHLSTTLITFGGQERPPVGETS